MKKRFARIYPMYFILTSLTFVYYIIDPSFNNSTFQLTSNEADSFTLYLLNITFLRGFFHDVVFSGIGQGWTLTVEEVFYVLAPLIFLAKKKVPLLLQVIFFYLTGFILVRLCQNVNYLGLFEDNMFMLITTFFGRCLEFYIGIKLAIWYKGNKTRLDGGYYTYLSALSILLIVGILVFTKDIEAEYYLGLYSSAGLVINNLILPFAIAFFLKGLLTERTVVKRVLETDFAILLGRSSYVFYLIHMGFISELLHNYLTHNYLLNFPLLVLLSVAMYKYLEAPLNKLIRSF